MAAGSATGAPSSAHCLRRGLGWLHSLAVRQLITKNVIVALTPAVKLRKTRQAARGQQYAIQVRPVFDAESQIIGIKRVFGLACFQSSVMTKRQHTVKQHRIVSDCNPALSTRHSLWPLQAEAADIAPRSHRPSPLASVLMSSRAAATRRPPGPGGRSNSGLQLRI